MGAMRGGIAGATVAFVAAASCNQVAGIDPGDEGCRTVADCRVGEPACRTAVACQERVCIFEDAVEGKPLPEQTAGDCTQLVCDGAGSAKQVPMPADVPDDGKICTTDACDGTAPVHTLSDSVPCYNGPPGTEGVGICRAGLQRCDEQGKPVGSCDGEVTPQTEVCDSGSDEDCDGDTNEGGENCACGDGWVSAEAGEECDDGGAVDGDGCAASCVNERVVKIEAGDYHTCAVLNTGRIKCWGGNGAGQLGLGDKKSRGDLPGQMGSALPISDVGAGAKVESLALGSEYTCARLSNGALKCWGSNSSGQLGLGDTMNRGIEANQMGDHLEAVNLGGGATEVAAGWNYTCAIVDGYDTRCWGFNANGQLGLGDSAPRHVPPGLAVDLGSGRRALSLELGKLHACARLNDGNVKCWGNNVSGKLGFGGRGGAIGDDPNEMGENLPAVDLGDVSPLALSAGFSHTCALLQGGSVKCWGANEYGQLGLGDRLDRGADPSYMGERLNKVDVGEAVTAVAVGWAHTCALLDGGRVKCWGRNDYGQLGLGDDVPRGHAAGTMGDALPAVDLGEGATVEAITAGAYHTCALLTDGRVKCWGSNGGGTLGLGDDVPRGHAAGTMGDALPAVELFKSP